MGDLTERRIVLRALELLLDHGVIFVIANLRGGGEYGEQWHQQGNLTRKQNVFDDFAACLRHMIDRRYTTSRRLGIIGGSIAFCLAIMGAYYGERLAGNKVPE